MNDFRIDRRTFQDVVEMLRDWQESKNGNGFSKTAGINEEELAKIIVWSVLAAMAAGGGLGLAGGLASPKGPRSGDAMRASALSMLFGPFSSIPYGLARRYRAGQKEEADNDLAVPKSAASMAKRAIDQKTLLSILVPAAVLAAIFGPMGGGYLVGRYGPDRPEEIGRNEALYSALLSSIPVIGPFAGFGYAAGRDSAVSRGKKI